MFLPPPRGSAQADSVQEAYDMLELANDFFVNGDYNQAITHFEKAVPVLRDVDEEYVLRCEYCMAICYNYLQRIDDAIAQSLRVDAQNQLYDPMILNGAELADLFRRLSHLYLTKYKRLRQEDSNSLEADLCSDDAKLYLQKYLRMCQSGGGGGDFSRQLDAFRRFAAFFYQTGDYQSSCSYYNHALHLAERLHMEQIQLHCLTCMANSQVALGRLSEAIETYKSGLDLAMKIQADKAIQAQCTYRLGCALLLTRRYSDAILYFLAHERIASDLGDLEGRLHSLDRLIAAYREIGDYAEANKYSQHKDLLTARLGDSGMTNEMTSYSNDQTLRSNISAVEQRSNPSMRDADSFDNIVSRTFDSGQGISGQEVIPTAAQSQEKEPQDLARMYSFAYIDDGSSQGPSQATSVADLCDNFAKKPVVSVEILNKKEDIVVPPAATPKSESPQNDENAAPEQEAGPQKPIVEIVIENVPSEQKKEAKLKHKHQKKHTKRVAPTLPPEDTEFFDMLSRASTRRLDDQRAQLKPICIPSHEQVSAVVDVHSGGKNHNGVAEDQRHPAQSVTRTISNAAAADDLFLIVCKAQSRRLEDQRAVLRPVTARPEILPVKSDANGVPESTAAVRFVNNASSQLNNNQKGGSSPTSISLIQPSTNSTSKSSKARRFLSQLMK